MGASSHNCLQGEKNKINLFTKSTFVFSHYILKDHYLYQQNNGYCLCERAEHLFYKCDFYDHFGERGL